MGIFLKSPFKSNRLETNPYTYGLREDVIRESVVELLNDRSILLTGSRGIGKSSLGFQLQNILQGDTTLLNRCGMSATIPDYVTLDYTCTHSDTLKSIISDIVEQLNDQIDVFKKKYKTRKLEASLSLFNIFNIKAEMDSVDKEPALLKGFVDVIEELSDVFCEPHINILIDELDQLPADENIAHFIKCATEALNRRGITTLSFILAGQTSVVEVLLKQQQAFMRLVKHIDLKPLSDDDSLFVLTSALEEGDVPTEIEDRASNFLLQLSCGYPYSIHILGHEAFNDMCNQLDKMPRSCLITQKNVINAVKAVLISCNERFEETIKSVTPDERYLLSILSTRATKKIPLTFTASTISEILDKTLPEPTEDIYKLIKKLCRQQILAPFKI